ncbi:hypothetical protein [Halochromatium glycolicum]|uniref:Uncharacterized protein n=1 Tax=Halochromatium glycolicum TaxID=85075 RepID=A0AAJ0U187_9GAMM|nr:hypothetical protein [Halochromatium glycolicum]MBK1703389.1 hypothetical protein [Halochromatium glycolicum]
MEDGLQRFGGQAMAEVSKMPATVQDTIATLVLDELRDEARWETAFEQTNDAQWDAMIQQVQTEIDTAKTEPLK